MITVRKSNERGHANHGWLDSHHTFSFADYYDPNHMGFRALRVINEDRVDGREGFGTHPHRDMEIITYVLEGQLDHKDSMGTGASLKRGEVQRMSAGTGVLHSEMNSQKDPVHFLQIWILPKERGLTPSYEQKLFPEEVKKGKFARIVDRDARDGALKVHQDITLYSAVFDAGQSATQTLEHGGFGWLQVTSGALEVNGTKVEAGDGVRIENERNVTVKALKASEVLLFDLA